MQYQVSLFMHSFASTTLAAKPKITLCYVTRTNTSKNTNITRTWCTHFPQLIQFWLN